MAVYQRALRLLYVDELLGRVNRVFSPKVGRRLAACRVCECVSAECA